MEGKAYADVGVVNTFAGGVLDRHNNSRRHGDAWLSQVERDKGLRSLAIRDAPCSCVRTHRLASFRCAT